MKVEFTRKTTQALEKRLQWAQKIGNIAQITKIGAILMLAHKVEIQTILALWCISERTLYNWRNDFLHKGFACFRIVRRTGRKSRLTNRQKAELKEIVAGKPEDAGFDQGCWTSLLVKEVIEKKFKVTYHRNYVCALLGELGFSWQKGKFVSDKADPVKRDQWKNETWPQLLQRAKRENAVLLFEDEVGFALWGSLGYTWALKGKQPEVKTTGKRKKLKAFGAIDYFTGKFVFQTEEGKLNGRTYISFLKKLLKRFPNRKIILIHDGAPYHRSKKVKSFFESNEDFEEVGLPAYSPDFNIIEYLWKNVKGRLHNKYFSTFAALKKDVHRALKHFQRNASAILNLCGSYPEMLLGKVPKAA